MILKDLNKKQIAIILLIIITFIAVLVFLFMLIPSNKYGQGIGINNYNKYISNLPTDRRDSINKSLYNISTINSQNSNVDIKDATIRDGSAKYDYNQTTNINSGSFIVDIESLKQSYLVSYEWSSDNPNSNMSGYSALVTCLPSSDLIYGDFNCKDGFSSSASNSNIDPILEYLPYSTFNLDVTANIQADDTVDLTANITLYLSDTRDGQMDESIIKYKLEVVDWIKSIGLNPDNYIINYNVF